MSPARPCDCLVATLPKEKKALAELKVAKTALLRWLRPLGDFVVDPDWKRRPICLAVGNDWGGLKSSQDYLSTWVVMNVVGCGADIVDNSNATLGA
eukprot:2529820-Pyramimonas_sp.AAC.1